MPISHKHRAIFVHIPKNAGSSIEKALGIWGQNNDGAITPYCPEMLFGVYRGKAMQHLTMAEIKELGPIGSNGYFSFAFVQNPYSRAVSEYKWRLKEGYKFTFEAFVKRYYPIRKRFLASKKDKLFADHLTPQFHYTHRKESLYKAYIYQIVDYVGKLETFEADFKHIATRIGIDPICPHVNKSETTDWRAYYTKPTQKLIYEAYKQDFETFKYKYETL